MNSQEFLEFTKQFKEDKDGYIEIYNNEKTGTVMRISVPEIQEYIWKDDNYSIFITHIYNEKLGYGRSIVDEEEIIRDFFRTLSIEELEFYNYDYFDLYEKINFYNQKDIDNMIFEDDLFNKFYIENKEKYCFYCKFLPKKENYFFNVCAEEFSSFNKLLDNCEIIEMYEYLVKNNL